MFFCGYAVDRCPFPMREDLVLLAYRTSLDVVGYPFFHVGPVIVFLRFPQRLVSTGVSCGRVIVYEGHYPSFYFVECWYQGSSFRGYSCDCEFGFWEDDHILVVFLPSIRPWWSG